MLYSKDKKTLIRFPANFSSGYSLDIPEGVETIKANAFSFTDSECSRVKVPKTVTTIEKNAFFRCHGMWRIYVDKDNPNYSSSKNGLLFNKDKTKLLAVPCSQKDVLIPETVTEIEKYAVSYGQRTESYPRKNITIATPNLERIPEGAFAYNISLEQINLPQNLKYIGPKAFLGSEKLVKVVCYAENPNTITLDGSDIFPEKLKNTCTLYVPENSLAAYKADSKWASKFKEIKPIIPVSEIKFSCGNDKLIIGKKEKIHITTKVLPENATFKVLYVKPIPTGDIIGLDVGGSNKDKLTIEGRNVGAETISVYAGMKKQDLQVEVINEEIGMEFSDGKFKYEVTHAHPLQVEVLLEDGGTEENIPVSVNFSGKKYAVTSVGLSHYAAFVLNMPEGVKEFGVRVIEPSDNFTRMNFPASIEKFWLLCVQSAYLAKKDTANLVINGNNSLDYLADPQSKFTLFVPNGSKRKYAVKYPKLKDRIIEMKDIVPVKGISFKTKKKTVAKNERGFNISELVKFEPANASDKSLTFTSNNPDVISFGRDKYGNITCHHNGTVGVYTITAKSTTGNYTAAIELNVVNQEVGNRFKAGGLYYKVVHISPLEVVVFTQNTDSPYFDAGEKPKGAIVIPKEVTHNSKTYKVTGIDGRVFRYNTDITTLNILAEITELEYEVFEGCTQLKSVNLPNSLKNMYYAFKGCTSLTSINIPDSVTDLNGAFEGCTSLTTVNIPESVTDLDYTFKGCSSLTTVNIPESVTGLDYTFVGCQWLTSIKIPNSVTYLGSAFIGCTSLTSINIPNSVTRAWNIFYNCTSLKTANIPASIKNINRDMFKGCGALEHLYVAFPEPELIDTHADVFNEVNTNTCVLHVPAGTKKIYKNLAPWSKFVHIEEDIILVKSISLNKTEVTLPKGESFQLSVTAIKPDNASNKEYVFSTNNNYSISLSPDGKVVALEEGVATVTVKSKDGNAKAECRITVGNPSAIEDVKASQVNVYPNPSSGHFFVDVPNNGQLQIMNLSGQLIGNKRLNQGKNEININKPGLYLLRIGGKDFSVVKKIIIR